jgi:hypothetical protein
MNIVITEIDKLSTATKNTGDNYGLYRGRTGVCICHFLLSRLTGDQIYLEKAREILNTISDNIAATQELNFSDGLAGIGWGVEWLVQNNYVESNTDEVLEDIDNELYKSVVYAKSPDISLSNGTIGKIMYFYKRLLARNPNPSRYRNICHQECIVILTDELNDFMLNDNSGLLNKSPGRQLFHHQIKAIAETLMLLPKLYKLKINFEVVQRLICTIIYFIEDFCKEECYISNIEPGSFTPYLIYSYHQAGLSLNDRAWTKSANRISEKMGAQFPIDSPIFNALSIIEAATGDQSWKEAFLL